MHDSQVDGLRRQVAVLKALVIAMLVVNAAFLLLAWRPQEQKNATFDWLRARRISVVESVERETGKKPVEIWSIAGEGRLIVRDGEGNARILIDGGSGEILFVDKEHKTIYTIPPKK